MNPVINHDDRLVVLSIRNKDKREAVFKYTDDPVNAAGVVSRTASKRVVTVPLFNKLQPVIDSHKPTRVSLLDQLGEDDDIDDEDEIIDHDGQEYVVVVGNTAPHSYDYDEILRRIRF